MAEYLYFFIIYISKKLTKLKNGNVMKPYCLV